MYAWPRTIVTDSGGFQAYSLIQQNPKFGTIKDDGITFKPESAERKFHLTPEKTIQLQMSYGADVVICLDECTHVDASYEMQETSVKRTIAWARRCKKEFLHQVNQKRLPPEQRPLLFAVIRGGGSLELRKRRAAEELEMEVESIRYGGWGVYGDEHLRKNLEAY